LKPSEFVDKRSLLFDIGNIIYGYFVVVFQDN